MADTEIAVIDGGKIYVKAAGSPIYVKTADICAMTGKTNQWIGQLTSQGVLNKTKTAHGTLYDLIETMRAYCDMLEQRIEAASKPKKTEKEIKREEARAAADVSIKMSKASILKFEADELAGKMHRAEDVEQMTEQLIYTIRNAMVALPSRLAKDTAAATTAAETYEIIRKEVGEAMKEISDFKYDPAKYDELVRERRKLGQSNDEDD
ncbi:MAG: hypothetical protein ACI3VY_02025 [Faecousia sp.]